ncbi:DUF998 domain-containing protein [Reinekea blandensis]|uniref:DUF998 domain-containing protein n=1 Tax=Reinekea blandensis MED297 TaxID=314283 RepID=A4BDB6_9GAMM|nr:DUF998 domain-containing protein [Reinekea blandensis]EAR09860.1 hypothetical protein MED297_05909 [Reinekea sp. MED297] [Reinekea blandensis MED297]
MTSSSVNADVSKQRSISLLTLLPVVSLGWLVIAILLAGAAYPGYSHLTQFMSELGATGAPHGIYVNMAGFLVAELLVLGFVVLAFGRLQGAVLLRASVLMIAVYALLIIVASFFTCDFQCRPESPTLSHSTHMASAALAYLSALFAVLLAALSPSQHSSRAFRLYSLLTWLACSVVMGYLISEPQWIGFWQRVYELLIYTWMIVFAFQVQRKTDAQL